MIANNRNLLLMAMVLCGLMTVGCLDGGDSAADGSGLSDLFGEELLNVSRETVKVADLADKKVAIYFSAQWCPPCRQFTPLLVNAHRELRSQGKPFEVVFVSGDQSDADMWKYVREYRMPWLVIPFGDERVRSLNARFSVRGIPRLVVVDGSGRVLSNDARGDVASKGAAAWDSW